MYYLFKVANKQNSQDCLVDKTIWFSIVVLGHYHSLLYHGLSLIVSSKYDLINDKLENLEITTKNIRR